MKRWLIGSIVAGGMLVLSALFLPPVRFTALGVTADVSEGLSRTIASSLTGSEWGVDLALNDLNVVGGTNDGWSQWILRHSTRDSQVTDALSRRMSDASTQLGDRLIAADILWRRTTDPAYFITMVSLVSPPAGEREQTVVGNIRSLMSVDLQHLGLNAEAEAMQVPADQPVNTDPVSLEPVLREAVEKWRDREEADGVSLMSDSSSSIA